MAEEKLCESGKKRCRYSSYSDETRLAGENVIDRDSHATSPKEEWLTDITVREFIDQVDE